MEQELSKQNWENARHDNINIILTSKYQIILAQEAIKLCDKKLAEFPEDICECGKIKGNKLSLHKQDCKKKTKI